MALHQLRVQAATCFVLSEKGRIERENDPDCSEGPFLYFAGCGEGNVALLRHDVAADVADAALALLDGQPPWTGGDAPFLEPLAAIVGRHAPVGDIEKSIIYRLPHAATAADGVEFICSDTPEGDDLLAGFRRDGLPQPLVAAGFKTLEDFWEPWCAAAEGGAIAAIAFAARLGSRGAEIGVHTFGAFRGRGFAAAVTARWASLPALRDRELFYSTSETNLPSQRVADKMGLARIGSGLRLG